MDELDRIRWAAVQSVGRGCLFALLAIGMTMFGLISWPILAFRSGAVLSMMLLAVLVLRGELAGRQDYRRTETWLLMGRQHALPESHAARAILGILRDTYRRFALYAAAIAVACWALMFLATALQPPGAPWVLT
jgi:hypothetical protein